MKIGYRTLKTAVGTTLAIGTAQFFGFQFYASAGILTILCIKKTRKRSLASAWERFLACVVGMGFATVLFEVLGYHPWTMGVVLLAMIPALLRLRAQEGIITSSVIILHLYSLEKITAPILINELAIILIGIGYALLMNLYMPNREKDLESYRDSIEANLKQIFHEFARFLREGNMDWDGREIAETARLLEEARRLALIDVENRIHLDEDYYVRYFRMRRKQFAVIERVMGILSRLDRTCAQGHAVADFLEGLGDAVHPGNTARLFLQELDDMRREFRDSPLPQTRREFETRAALLQFIHEIKQYLLIKKKYSPDWFPDKNRIQAPARKDPT